MWRISGTKLRVRVHITGEASGEGGVKREAPGHVEIDRDSG